jgi:hypothetical protein
MEHHFFEAADVGAKSDFRIRAAVDVIEYGSGNAFAGEAAKVVDVDDARRRKWAQDESIQRIANALCAEYSGKLWPTWPNARAAAWTGG